MKFGVVGLTYKEQTTSIREKFAWTTSKIIEFQSQLSMSVSEHVVLSTCNRFEIYFLYEDYETLFSKKLQILTLIQHKENSTNTNETLTTDLGELFWAYEHQHSLEHLFSVVAGLESMVLGEDQILGQVKTAWEQSLELGFTGKCMNRIFMEAIRFAKNSKKQTHISDTPVSIASIAMKELHKKLDAMSEPHVLIVGHGAMGKLCLDYLLEYSKERNSVIYSTSRNTCTSEITEFNSRLIPYDERYTSLEHMDAVVSATSSPHCIFYNHRLTPQCKTSIWIDLALPLDIDPAISNREGTTLIGLDHINIIAEENNRLRKAAAESISELIPFEVEKLEQWLISVKSDEIIQSLQEQVNHSINDSMKLIRKKVTLSEKELTYIETIFNVTLQRFIKSPIQYLKKSSSEEIDEAMDLIKRFYL